MRLARGVKPDLALVSRAMARLCARLAGSVAAGRCRRFGSRTLQRGVGRHLGPVSSVWRQGTAGGARAFGQFGGLWASAGARPPAGYGVRCHLVGGRNSAGRGSPEVRGSRPRSFFCSVRRRAVIRSIAGRLAGSEARSRVSRRSSLRSKSCVRWIWGWRISLHRSSRTERYVSS